VSDSRKPFNALKLVLLEFLVLWGVETLHRVVAGPLWVLTALIACAAGIYAARGLGFRLGDLLTPEYGAALFVFLSLWIAAGTLVVQGREPAFYLSRYGVWARPMLALSLDHVFFAGWFRGLLALLGVSLVGVSFRRPSWPFRMIHLGVALVLMGGLISDLGGVRGYMKLKPNRQQDMLILQRQGRMGAGHLRLPFSLTLKEFRVERYPARPQLRLFQRRGERFVRVSSVDPRRVRRLNMGECALEVLEVNQRISRDGGRGLTATLRLICPGASDAKTFRLAADSRPVLLPGGSYALELRTLSPPREYASRLAFQQNEAVREAWVRVNHPVRFQRYRFFQSGYGGGNDPFSGITVKRDPGFPVVAAGLILFLAGLLAGLLRRRS